MDSLSLSRRDPDYTFKILLIGNSNVGKSSLLYRYETGVFKFLMHATIGQDFCYKTINVDGKKVKLQLWDTGRQEEFRAVCQTLVRNAHGILFIYDCADRNSLESIEYWVQFVHQSGMRGAAMMLVGNKADIPKNIRTIQTEEGQAVARRLGLPFFETSARSNYKVDAVFQALVVEVMQKIEEKKLEYKSSEQIESERIKLHNQEELQPRSNQRCGCC